MTHFYQTWSGPSWIKSSENYSPVSNFAAKIMKFCTTWEVLSLLQITKFHNCRDKTSHSRVFKIDLWSKDQIDSVW